MKARYWIAAAALGLAAGAGLSGAALADTPVKTPASSCFYSFNWTSWRSPDQNTIYFRVGVRDIYKVDLSGGSRLLTFPESHLISQIRGSDIICNPIDLDLRVSEDGIQEPLFVKAITKLTAAEVAAIPKKYLP